MEASGAVEGGVRLTAELAHKGTPATRESDWPLAVLFFGGVPALYAAVGFGLYELFAFVF